MNIEVGTKVRTLCQHSETAKIVRARKSSLPLPGADWVVIQLDHDGGQLCVHRNALEVIAA